MSGGNGATPTPALQTDLSPPPTDAPGASKAILTARSMTHENRAEMRSVFDRALSLAEHGQLPLHVPHEAKAVQKLRGMHYHYRPEIFLQLQGTTDFHFPREDFRLGEDEMCIIPAGVPHGEHVQSSPGRPFRNLVAGFYNNTLSIHFAHEARPGRPDIEAIEFFDAPNLDFFLALANGLAQARTMNSPAQGAVQKGLVLALLGLFRNIVETGSGHLNSDIGKVFQAKCLVREQFSNPELRVQHVADTLGCSADYLSHLFHSETKERMTHYIQRIRIQGAILALETTALNVSEIAYASGFSDPAYFTRVFRQHKGVTPQVFRVQINALRNQRESQPKTVYADRVDFTHGTPREKPKGRAAQPGLKVSLRA
jgi:AraC-like DNA-binding protein/mannose-6-phosphate isomerase-like protein (cupin superfamily)